MDGGGQPTLLRRFIFASLCLLGLLAVTLFHPRLPASPARAAPLMAPPYHVVISEFRTTGPNGGNDEFIELFNPTGDTLDIGDWKVNGSNSTGGTSTRATIPAGISLAPGQHYLLTNSSSSGGPYSGSVAGDLVYATGIADNGGIAIINKSNVIVDQVGMSSGSAYKEGTTLTPMTNANNQSYERTPGGALGSCIDSDQNDADFQFNSASSDPQNSNIAFITICADAATATVTRTGITPLTIIINEVAWGGTQAGGSSAQWIELYNPGAASVNLAGWHLIAADGIPDIALSGTIAAGGYYLLERTESATDVASDLIFPDALEAGGETLYLRAVDGNLVDTVNANGGPWPSGSGYPDYRSMERNDVAPEGDSSWITYDGTTANAHDSGGNPILGTPKHANWAAGMTQTLTPTTTRSPTPTGTGTATATPTVTVTFTPDYPIRTVVINEVAWAGTLADSEDEWIELYNPGSTAINLIDWTLKSTTGDPTIHLNGVIAAQGYYLLRSNSGPTPTPVTPFPVDFFADQFYDGNLSNSGEILQLISPAGVLVDTANSDGGSWTAGSVSNYATMERVSKSGVPVADSFCAWMTFGGTGTKHDSAGNIIRGTPRYANWAATTATPPSCSSPTRTRTPTPYYYGIYYATPTPAIVLNEFLPHPGSDWNGDGQIDVNDEFIEIMNVGTQTVTLSGWRLDHIGPESSSYALPTFSLQPGEKKAFFRSVSGLPLNDNGDTVRLLRSNGGIADAYTYPVVPEPDLSWCRLPDGMERWFFGCRPTAAKANIKMLGSSNLPSGTSLFCLLQEGRPEVLAAECLVPGLGIWRRDFWKEEGDGFLYFNDENYPAVIH
jgi:hypothetical protein